jgi:heme exporter protein A
MRNRGIVCEGLCKKYGELIALRNLDLTINPGDFISLFGPNGAGKTTLMKTICGLTHPTSGKASVGDSDVSDPDVRKKIGVISHKSYLYDNLTAFENVHFYAELYEVDNPSERANELLKSVELYERKHDFVRHFSRGMLQRLSIARALVADPDFIFLDEPFTGLDQHSTDLFRKLLRGLHTRGKTVMMITHDIHIGIEESTRALILKSGRKVYDENTAGLTVDEFKTIYNEKVGS